jgi:hypothetical protein
MFTLSGELISGAATARKIPDKAEDSQRRKRRAVRGRKQTRPPLSVTTGEPSEPPEKKS